MSQTAAGQELTLPETGVRNRSQYADTLHRQDYLQHDRFDETDEHGRESLLCRQPERCHPSTIPNRE